MGGAYSANADSVPLLVISGNAPASTFGRNATMEFSGAGRRPDPARLFAPLTKHSSAERTWRFGIEVSLLTAMRAARLVAEEMRARKSGRIVNMSTESAFCDEVA